MEPEAVKVPFFKASNAPSPFRALKNPNYSLYFFGQVLSMAGTWMQGTAQAWLVYRLSHSAAWLGIITFCNQVPAFLMSPMAGVIADIKDRRIVLLFVQIGAMIQALLMAALVFSGKIAIWHIAILTSTLGIINAFDMTTRHAFAVDMVGKKDLPSAIALNSLIVNGSRVLGPTLAGVLISIFSEGWCFLLNAISYLAVIVALMKIKIPPKIDLRQSKAQFFQHIGEATRYIAQKKEISHLLFFGGFISLVAFPYVILLPAIAKDILHGDAATLGLISAINGVGAIFGGLSSARIGSYSETWNKLISRLMVVGAAFIVFSFISNIWLTLPVLLVIGFLMLSIFPTINNSIQLLVDDQVRGRVMSVYTMTFLGTTPIGSLIAGGLADRYGTSSVLWMIGGTCMLCGLALKFRRSISLRCFQSAGDM